MAKEWKCTQCGKVQTRSLMGHLRTGPPEACDNCGNDKFEETIFGGTHSVLDSMLS